MDLGTVYSVASAVALAAVGVLAVVAPLTKTQADNKVLAFLQRCLGMLGKGAATVVAPTAAAKNFVTKTADKLR